MLEISLYFFLIILSKISCFIEISSFDDTLKVSTLLIILMTSCAIVSEISIIAKYTIPPTSELTAESTIPLDKVATATPRYAIPPKITDIIIIPKTCGLAFFTIHLLVSESSIFFSFSIAISCQLKIFRKFPPIQYSYCILANRNTFP